MDAWEDDIDCLATSPEKQKYISKMIDSNQAKGSAVQRAEVMSEKVESNFKLGTPPPADRRKSRAGSIEGRGRRESKEGKSEKAGEKEKEGEKEQYKEKENRG